MGRLASRSYPDGSVVSFTYTPTGRRATATDARGTTSYGYDVRDRLAQITYPDGRKLSYGYDARGERTRLTAQVGSTSLTTTTSYDAVGRIAGVTDPLGRGTSLTYDAAGERTRLGYPNGTQTSYSYDARGHVTNVSAVSGATTVASFGYTLDAAGKRTRIAEADGTNRVYGYDALERLTQETVTGALSYGKTFTYGVTGNRLTQVTTGTGAASVAYTYDLGDRLKTENATSYTYDANGNVTSKAGEATYAWDFENRLTSVTMSDGTVVSHVYDVDGHRVRTTVTPPAGGGATVVTNMLVDASGGLSHVVAETDGAGALQAYYVRAGNELLAVTRPAPGGTWTTRYVHSDALGSVRTLTDETGTTTDTRGYEAFGPKNVQAGNDPLAYGFAGEPFDAPSKLAYHRARWMDARIGRFFGIDPSPGRIDLPNTLHPFTYAANSSTNLTDASGRQYSVPAIGAALTSAVVLSMLATPALTGNNADRIGSSCRVDVRASLLSSIPQGGPDLFWQAIPAWHLFIVCRDDMGKTMMYEGDKGGAGVDGTFGALIGSEPKELSSLPPRSNEAITPYSATVMSGPEACGMSACVGRALRSFNQQKPAVAYNPFGPNSNTLAKTLLTSCNIPIDKPPVFTLGWDSDPLR